MAQLQAGRLFCIPFRLKEHLWLRLGQIVLTADGSWVPPAGILLGNVSDIGSLLAENSLLETGRFPRVSLISFRARNLGSSHPTSELRGKHLAFASIFPEIGAHYLLKEFTLSLGSSYEKIISQLSCVPPTLLTDYVFCSYLELASSHCCIRSSPVSQAVS